MLQQVVQIFKKKTKFAVGNSTMQFKEEQCFCTEHEHFSVGLMISHHKNANK